MAKGNVSIAKEKGGLRVLLYALLLFVAGVALWQSLENKKSDITNNSSQLSSKVNSVLLHSGFKDSDIVSQVSRENKNNSLKWISFEKEINVPKNANFVLMKEQLNILAKEYGFNVVWKKLDFSQKVEILKQNNCVLSLQFNFSKEIKTPEQKIKKINKAHKK